MTLQHKKQQGFTIVELLVVIVVIGILALITITTFTGVTQRSRDAKRESDIKAIHGQLEAFYAQNNYYPSLDQLNSETFRSANLKGLDPASLKDPKGSETSLVDGQQANRYTYTARNSSDAACSNLNETDASDDCVSYTLSAGKETGGRVEKKSLN